VGVARLDCPQSPSKKLSMVGDRARDKRLAAVGVAFVTYTAVMMWLERRMRATGGPGIIPFELAGSAARVEDIMTRWGSDGQRAARLPLFSTSDTWQPMARSRRCSLIARVDAVVTRLSCRSQ
jgi:hypothetical protein